MVKSYKPLFKKNKNNKDIKWYIRIYVDDTGKVFLLIERGLVTGKLVQDKILVTGKASRTDLEQAELEANSRYRKKLRENYREKGSTQELALKPYLLMQYSHKKEKINFPAYIQPKLDGVRSLFGYFNNDLKFISRRCLEFPNKLEHIKADFLKSKLPNSKKIFFDGEIYIHSSKFKASDINGIVNTTPESKTWDEKKSKLIQFHIFDYFDLDNLDLTFEERYKNLSKMFAKATSKTMMLIPQQVVKNDKQVQKIYNMYLRKGYEGAVIRNKHFKYNIKGDRICNALKIKESHEEEFKIIDADKSIYGEVIWILQLSNKKGTFRAPHTGTQNNPITREERQQLYKDRKKYFGKMATVAYQEETIHGKPRHGRVIKIRML